MTRIVENAISTFGELSVRELDTKQLKILLIVASDMKKYAKLETRLRSEGIVKRTKEVSK